MSRSAGSKGQPDLKKRQELETGIDKLDQRIDVATENGLFTGNPNVRAQIIESLRKTRQSLEKEEYSECATLWSITWGLYSDALNSKKYRWRLVNLHAIHIWIYLIAILVSIFSIYYSGLLGCPAESAASSDIVGDERLSISNGSQSKIPALAEECYLNKLFGKDVIGFHAVTWGCIGAIFRGLWYLKDRVNQKLYRNAWNIYFLSAPFLGGILGAIVYFIIIGGIISVTPGNVNIQHSIPVILFATLAGFNWEWAVRLFRKIGDGLSPAVENDSK